MGYSASLLPGELGFEPVLIPRATLISLTSLSQLLPSAQVNCEFSLKASAKPAILKTAHLEILDQLCPLSRPWFCHLYSGRVPSEVG